MISRLQCTEGRRGRLALRVESRASQGSRPRSRARGWSRVQASSRRESDRDPAGPGCCGARQESDRRPGRLPAGTVRNTPADREAAERVRWTVSGNQAGGPGQSRVPHPGGDPTGRRARHRRVHRHRCWFPAQRPTCEIVRTVNSQHRRAGRRWAYGSEPSDGRPGSGNALRRAGHDRH